MTTPIDSHLSCLDCSAPITTMVFLFTSTNLGLPLCGSCQIIFKERSIESSKEALDLYVALRKRKVPAELEKWDGYKTIDIAVVHARVNIAVSAPQQHLSPKQAMADLKRTYYSSREGFLTLRIPDSLVKYHLEYTADYITEFLRESRDQHLYN